MAPSDFLKEDIAFLRYLDPLTLNVSPILNLALEDRATCAVFSLVDETQCAIM